MEPNPTPKKDPELVKKKGKSASGKKTKPKLEIVRVPVVLSFN